MQAMMVAAGKMSLKECRLTGWRRKRNTAAKLVRTCRFLTDEWDHAHFELCRAFDLLILY